MIFFYSELIDIIFLNYSDKLDFYNNSIIIVVKKKNVIFNKNCMWNEIDKYYEIHITK